jgi:hypothetical protein
MTLRNCLSASALFCCFTALAAAQGTLGGKTEILKGFTPLSEKELQEGVIRLFDGVSTFGWKGDPKVEDGKLFSTGKLEETPLWFFVSRTYNQADNQNVTSPIRLVRKPLKKLPSLPKRAGFDKMDSLLLESPTQSFTKFNVRLQKFISLFDGKTLNGWTIRGEAKADIKDGVLRLTNGSGSLESDGKYGDFVLQLEYLTPERPEGKGVNSGVFFRCIPGETMNGYECQILNNPGEKDYKSYIGTDTGGIFRRQAGRNVGPKDGEWNYLTIAAKGNRMATWVNGIQVTDWTDERKPHQNPRNGCRTEAGTIQFQGHDPSTEILLRNIRIRELQED